MQKRILLIIDDLCCFINLTWLDNLGLKTPVI